MSAAVKDETNKVNKRSKNFKQAYLIKGRGVGHLDLDRATQSEEFIAEVKKLSSTFKEKYIKEN